MAKETDRKTVMGILTKLGVEFTSKINLERATAKIERKLKKDGVPEGVEFDDKEISCLTSMGFEIEEEDENENEEAGEVDEVEKDEEEDEEEEEEERDEEEKVEPISKKKSSKKKEKDEEEEPKKKNDSKKDKNPAEPIQKRITRIAATIVVLRKRQNHTIERLIQEADEIYVSTGGKANETASKYSVNQVLEVLAGFGLIETKNEKVRVL